MKLNRREGTLLTVLVLAWALSSLLLHFLLPQYADHTGAVMGVGLLVAGIALVALLRSVARRLDGECRECLASLGFQVVDLGPELIPDWIPAEHRDRPRLVFDGFQSPRNIQGRSGYERVHEGLGTFLFGYLCGRERRREAYIVMRIESPLWSWPEFACAVGSRWSGIHPIEGWEWMQFDEDPAFLKGARPPNPTGSIRSSPRSSGALSWTIQGSASSPRTGYRWSTATPSG